MIKNNDIKVFTIPYKDSAFNIEFLLDEGSGMLTCRPEHPRAFYLNRIEAGELRYYDEMEDFCDHYGPVMFSGDDIYAQVERYIESQVCT